MADPPPQPLPRFGGSTVTCSAGTARLYGWPKKLYDDDVCRGDETSINQPT
jgi:hypothetical protein